MIPSLKRSVYATWPDLLDDTSKLSDTPTGAACHTMGSCVNECMPEPHQVSLALLPCSECTDLDPGSNAVDVKHMFCVSNSKPTLFGRDMNNSNVRQMRSRKPVATSHIWESHVIHRVKVVPCVWISASTSVNLCCCCTNVIHVIVPNQTKHFDTRLWRTKNKNNNNKRQQQQKTILTSKARNFTKEITNRTATK